MVFAPETHYARDGDLRIAYQVVGDRGPDLLFVPTGMFPIDLIWDEPTVAGYLRRLASFSRLILTDLVGAGSSDSIPINERPPLQSWTDGYLAVLDAVGSESASVFAMSGTGLAAMQLAASHPRRRVRSLVLWSPYARYVRAADYPVGIPETLVDRYVHLTGEMMGTGALVDQLAPSWSGDAAKRRWWARGERLCGGPTYFVALLDVWIRIDVRPVLSSIQAPTLLLHRRGDRDVRRDHVADLAERIPHAPFVEFDGDDNVWFAGDAERVIDEIESFITGQRAAPRRTGCWRRCCSPTSSNRRNEPRS